MYRDSRHRHFLPNTTSQRTQNQHHNARPVPPWMRFDENQNLPMVKIFLYFHIYIIKLIQPCWAGRAQQKRQDAMRSLSVMGVSFSRSHPGMEKQQDISSFSHAPYKKQLSSFFLVRWESFGPHRIILQSSLLKCERTLGVCLLWSPHLVFSGWEARFPAPGWEGVEKKGGDLAWSQAFSQNGTACCQL